MLSSSETITRSYFSRPKQLSKSNDSKTDGITKVGSKSLPVLPNKMRGVPSDSTLQQLQPILSTPPQRQLPPVSLSTPSQMSLSLPESSLPPIDFPSSLISFDLP